MLRIGYIRLRDQESANEGAILKSLGCHVVRAEESRVDGQCAVLSSILDFVGPGDQLVVSRLGSLGGSARVQVTRCRQWAGSRIQSPSPSSRSSLSPSMLSRAVPSTTSTSSSLSWSYHWPSGVA